MPMTFGSVESSDANISFCAVVGVALLGLIYFAEDILEPPVSSPSAPIFTDCQSH